MSKETHGFAPDFDEMPDPEAPGYEENVRVWFSGSYQSGWSDLIWSTYSSAITSLVAAQDLIRQIPTFIEKAKEPGEAAFVLSFNHRIRVSGPALGAVLTSAFALESFLRLGFAVGTELRHRRGRAARSAGYSAQVATDVEAFDALSASERLTALGKLVQAPLRELPRRAVSDLIAFRNEIAHDSPVLRTATGDALKLPRKGRAAAHRERIGPYDSLKSTDRAVRIVHVAHAISAHDDAVSSLLRTARLAGWAQAVTSAATVTDGQIRTTAPKSGWFDALVDNATFWESAVEEQFASSIVDLRLLRSKVVRRMRIKVLK